ncbi:MAG: hydrogenase assembly protein HupF [Acidimicrobiales bacterium]
MQDELVGQLPVSLATDLARTSFALAGSFARGATMWCISPSWPSHAHHVAVEFVHPVIVGKRALPAVVADGQHLVDDLRVLARSGDILLAVAPHSDATVADAMRRARPWGLVTVWIGAGERPPEGAADHVLWMDEENPEYGGGFVLSYHLLWELTHVCFEHPGLLTGSADADTGAGAGAGPPRVCITCSDEGRLAEVVSVGPDSSATVRTPAGLESVDSTLVEGPVPGDLVLVHAGSVMTILDAEGGGGA